MNEWIVFYNYEEGDRVFGFYGSEEEAMEAKDKAVEAYKKLNTAVQVGIANITDVTTLNWPE